MRRADGMERDGRDRGGCGLGEAIRAAVLLGAALWPCDLAAQSCPAGVVLDAAGLAVAGAEVRWRAADSEQTMVTGVDGSFRFTCGGDAAVGTLRATSVGLTSGEVAVGSVEAGRLVERPTLLAQQVTVAATRSAVSLGPQSQTVVTLDAAELRNYAALTLDERLRQVAGFELFRRASSWAANPTSEGVSLRALGSTAASRSLVLADGAPLNDGFGGWVHWNEIPPEAITGVSVAAGGGSDLYGSSALGGVIDVLTARPVSTRADGAFSGASEDTTDGHGRVDLARGAWGGLAAGEGFRTAGYIPTAPGLIGSIDRPADVHFQNGRVALERRQGPPDGASGRAYLTANLLNEARGNGTELQTNGSRIWRWLAGDDWSAGEHASGRARVFGSDEGYRQTFSSINANRSVETLTRQQRTETQEVGGSADATIGLRRVALVFGADVRDLRATDAEQPVTRGSVSSTSSTSARQRFVGGFGELLGGRGGWSGAASLRVDSAVNLDTRTAVFTPAGVVTSVAPVGYRSEIVLSPRVGVVRELGRGVQLHAEGFRAFRAPTMNELYRAGQVGQELTLANSGLRSERATGVEGGVAWHGRGLPVTVASSYFWTEINRPVSAVLVSSTATAITNRRENLGQIQSQGADLRVRLFDGHAISAAVGYQYAHAVVTAFSVQTGLIGAWIPNVPRQSVTAQLRAQRARWGEVTVAMRASGLAFDDSSNLYPLHRFAVMDVYGEHALPRGWTAFVSVQNLFNERPEVARTPLLTLGNPVLAQGGVRFGWGGR